MWDDDVTTYETTKETCPLCGHSLPSRKTEGRVFTCCYEKWTVENGQWVYYGLDYDEDV